MEIVFFVVPVLISLTTFIQQGFHWRDLPTAIYLHCPAICWVTLYTLWSFKEMCHQLLFKLRLGWQSLSFEWKAFPTAYQNQNYRIIVRSETYKGPWGSSPREAKALDLQILITLCVYPSEPHSPLLRRKRSRGGHLGTYSTSWGWKLECVTQEGCGQTDWLTGRKWHGR